MPRRGEHRVATWRIEVPDTGATVEVGVWMVDAAGGRHRSESERKTHFEARNDDLRIRLTDTDIDALRRAVEKELTLRMTVKWDLYLYVRADGGYEYENGQGLSFGYEWVALGRRKDGVQVWTRASEPDCGPFCEGDVREGRRKPHEHARLDKEKGLWNGVWDGQSHRSEEPQEGTPKVGMDESHYSGSSRMLALVPATPEAFAAVTRFLKGVEALRGEIQRRFAPKFIDGTLRQLLVPALGPGPEEP